MPYLTPTPHIWDTPYYATARQAPPKPHQTTASFTAQTHATRTPTHTAASPHAPASTTTATCTPLTPRHRPHATSRPMRGRHRPAQRKQRQKRKNPHCGGLCGRGEEKRRRKVCLTYVTSFAITNTIIDSILTLHYSEPNAQTVNRLTRIHDPKRPLCSTVPDPKRVTPSHPYTPPPATRP